MRNPLNIELPAPHSRGVERDRDLFCAGYRAAQDDYEAAWDRALAALKDLHLHASLEDEARGGDGKYHDGDAIESLIAELEEVKA